MYKKLAILLSFNLPIQLLFVHHRDYLSHFKNTVPCFLSNNQSLYSLLATFLNSKSSFILISVTVCCKFRIYKNTTNDSFYYYNNKHPPFLLDLFVDESTSLTASSNNVFKPYISKQIVYQ